MKKKKLYIFFAIMTSIFLFTTAAICNLCTAGDLGEPITELEENIDTGEEASEEEGSEETQGEEEPESEEESQNEEAAPPTIELEIYEGPVYSQSDDICYYRIKANITGTPAPDVEFSKDDSSGSWGELKTQINISDPADTYTLIATAANSEGTASDSIVLDWGCPVDDNNDPEISLFMGPPVLGNIYTNKEYPINVTASDPDGDSLTYSWSVSDGSIDDDTANPMRWTTPGTEGSYDVTVTVSDGRGGTDTETRSFDIYRLFEMEIPVIASEGGFIELDERTYPGGFFYAGDSDNNKICKGFISFDISSLENINIEHSSLRIDIDQILGDPSTFINKLELNIIDWGARTIIEDDFWITGDHIASLNDPNIMLNVEGIDVSGIGASLQQAIDAGKQRFQMSIHFTGNPGDSDGAWDGWKYLQSDAHLSIGYINK